MFFSKRSHGDGNGIEFTVYVGDFVLGYVRYYIILSYYGEENAVDDANGGKDSNDEEVLHPFGASPMSSPTGARCVLVDNVSKSRRVGTLASFRIQPTGTVDVELKSGESTKGL